VCSAVGILSIMARERSGRQADRNSSSPLEVVLAIRSLWTRAVHAITIPGTPMRAMRAASPSFRRKPIAAVLVVLCLVLSGCTARFIYNRLDTVATWYFQSLVSLNDAQRSELRAWL